MRGGLTFLAFITSSQGFLLCPGGSTGGAPYQGRGRHALGAQGWIVNGFSPRRPARVRLQATSGSGVAKGPPRVLCFGEALVDRLGPLGGDPACDLPVDDHLGGAPANVACGLARLGTRSAFLGRLGQDAIGDAFKHLFTERGVDMSGLQWDLFRPSRIVLVRRDQNGDRQFGGFEGDRGSGFADQEVDLVHLDKPLERLLYEADWLLVGTLPLASQASAEALEHAVEKASVKGVGIALDVNWRPTFWSGERQPTDGPCPDALRRIKPVLHAATLIKMAAEEARWIFGGNADPLAISLALPKRPAVIVTDGPNELRWSVGEAYGSMKPYVVDAVDTTGAGDGFLAGLLHAIGRDKDLLTGRQPERVEEAVRFATACGAMVCMAAGAIDPQPNAEDVDAFLKEKNVLLQRA